MSLGTLPTKPPVQVLGVDCAYTTHHQLVLSYFTGRLTSSSLRGLHAAHMATRAKLPAGTVTLALVGSNTAIPSGDIRREAALVAREASVGLLGEGIIVEGHPFWVTMARSALRAIQLLTDGIHTRSVFDNTTDGVRWALARAGRPESEVSAIVAQLEALAATMHGITRMDSGAPAP